MATKKATKGQSNENQEMQQSADKLPDTTEVVGNEFQDAVLKNKKRNRHPGNWQPMTEEELDKHQASGDLIGWDADRKEGLLRE